MSIFLVVKIFYTRTSSDKKYLLWRRITV